MPCIMKNVYLKYKNLDLVIVYIDEYLFNNTETMYGRTDEQ